MCKLITNELTKVFKRKNIYILLLIAMLIITIYNLLKKIENKPTNIQQQYQQAYKNDMFILEYYDKLNIKEPYEEIIERIKLEEYAIENKIEYNIFINSENSNVKFSMDSRILLMKTFENFDAVIIFIMIYLSVTIITEEYSNGTIKYILIKPYTRTKIILSKMLTNIFINVFLVIFIVLFQFILGGIIFGFDSYTLEAIRYNTFTQNIETTNLVNYMFIIILGKMSMYIFIIIISLLIGMIINNISLNVLISICLYTISNIDFFSNNIISKYIFIFNWDISKKLYNSTILLQRSIMILGISMLLLIILIIIIFNNKEIKNE